MLQEQEHWKNLARCKLFYPPYLIRGIPGSYSFTSSLKIIKWKTEIGSCRSSFSPSFRNTSSCSKLFEILLFLNSYTGLSVQTTRTSENFTLNLKIIKWKTEIGSCRSSFGPSFPNWEITGPYQLLLKIIWNTAFLR